MNGWLALLPLLLCAPAPAAATPQRLSDEQIAELETLATRGQAACEAKQYKACLDLFSRAQELLPWTPHEYYLGEALVGLGRLSEGVRTWEQMLGANPEPTDPVVVDAVNLARQRLSDVKPTIPTLLFQVAREHQARVRVRLDGVTLPAAELEHDIELDPGRHQFELSEPGFESEKHEITLAVGVHQQVLVALRALPTETPGLANDDEDSTWRVPVGWSLAAAGAGAAVGGLVVFLHKEGLNRELEVDCGPNDAGVDCPNLDSDAYNERTATIRTETTLSNVLIFGGAGLAALGAGTLIWDQVDRPARRDRPRVALVTTPTLYGVWVNARF